MATLSLNCSRVWGYAKESVVDAGGETGHGKLAYIDRSGKVIIPTPFNTDGDFERNTTDFSEGLASLSEGLARSVTGGDWVYINRRGEIVLTTSFDYAGAFSEGLACVYDSDSNKWGFIDLTGKVVIPLRYDSVSLFGFSEGLAAVAVK